MTTETAPETDESTANPAPNPSASNTSPGDCAFCGNALQKSSVREFDHRSRRTYLCQMCYAGAVTVIELSGSPADREQSRILTNARRLLDYGLTTCGTRVAAHVVECPPGTYRVVCDANYSVRVEVPETADESTLQDLAARMDYDRIEVRVDTSARVVRVIDADRTSFDALDADLPGV